MTCPVCCGQVQRQASVHTISRSSYHLMIYELPIWLCRRCGQAMYTESQVDALDDLIHAIDRRVVALLDASPRL
ncbi:MAG: YgiT-type zinc finger protein [Anaerolineae bacterium]